MPTTINEDIEWWPTPLGRVAVHPDGRLEETIAAGPIGERTISMEWSLLPKTMPPTP